MSGTDEGERQPYGIAQELHRLAAGVSPQPSRIKSPRSARLVRFPGWEGRVCGGGRRGCGLRRRRGLIRRFSRRRLLQIGDEGVLERMAAALLDQLMRRADGEHATPMHERDAVAALGLVHEMGREKDGDPVIAGEIDQRAPERVAGDRIDARRRLIENENGEAGAARPPRAAAAA